ncbi:hypothetical protein PUR61_41895 [Streptomyces sp. BE20]|nr:hypothetical protein [Streptomyces sp. BE20]MEE1828671.1 hypothetical protein [Streptomyces sp. BE20]
MPVPPKVGLLTEEPGVGGHRRRVRVVRRRHLREYQQAGARLG